MRIFLNYLYITINEKLRKLGKKLYEKKIHLGYV